MLEGMGGRAQCIVMGTLESVGDGEPKLIRLSISHEPTHMLDGTYTVHFGEIRTKVERRGGLWLWLMPASS